MNFLTKARAVADTITAPRPALLSAKLKPEPIAAITQSHMAEYAELAKLAGVKVPDLGIEAFKAFLEQHDIPVFALSEVVTYMDKRAAVESKERSGWEWRPLRQKDNRDGVAFGTRATRAQDQFGRRTGEAVSPGSDFYAGPGEGRSQGWNGESGMYKTPPSSLPYNRHIPLHALRKVALIEKDYGGDVAFFVSDYALAPQIEYPDPFLLAVVPNIDVKMGVGRFVIDFWDEPGFGLDAQLR